MASVSLYRRIPAVHRLIESPSLQEAISTWGRDHVMEACRAAVDSLRERIAAGDLEERDVGLEPSNRFHRGEPVPALADDVDVGLTAEQIHEQVREISTAVDISTVYRTLDLLRQFEIVACLDAGDGQNRYELLGLHGPHVHLVCQSCG